MSINIAVGADVQHPGVTQLFAEVVPRELCLVENAVAAEHFNNQGLYTTNE